MPWAEPEPPRDPVVQRGLDLLGAAVRRARRRMGWSQRQLGARTGIHQSTISRFERGDRVGLRFSRFAMLVAVLDGLDFLPHGVPRDPVFTTRRQWIEWEEAGLAEAVARHRLELLEEDDDDEVDDQDGASAQDAPAVTGSDAGS
jgi:transcriptional regulator with XRE-family HTH domain